MIVKSSPIKKILVVVFLVNVFFCSKLLAQNRLAFNTYYKVKERKNAIKIGLPALYFNNINLKYHRVINEQLSFQLSWAKYFETDLVKRFEGKTFNFRAYEADFSNFNEGKFYGYDVVVPELKLTGFYTQAEFRYQFSKKKLWTGFYAGPYFTYHQNFINNVIAYDDIGYNYGGQLDIKVFNMGVQSGYQWLIKKIILIDFHFSGVGWLWANHNLLFTTDNNNLNFEKIHEDLDASLANDFNFRQPYYTTSILENGLAYQIKFNAPMFRTGLSIGILF